MKCRSFLVFFISFFIFQISDVFATAPSASKTASDLESSIEKITQETQALQQEIKALKAELHQIKEQKQKVVQRASKAKSKKTQLASSRRVDTTLEKTAYLQPVLKGTPIMTSPILNIRPEVDVSDLLVSLSTMNEDLRFLQQRQELEKLLDGSELPSSRRPSVILSGKVEAQALYQYQHPNGSSGNINGFDLSGVELDVLAEASPWAYGFMSIDYDNTPLDPVLTGAGDVTNNSRLFLERGFLTIGNLNKSPVYFSMGQMYEPFGDYTTYMLSNPMTKVLGRTNARTAILGLAGKGLYLSAYVFDGPTGGSSLSELGGNGGYKFSQGKYDADVGVGVISNIADSQGMQFTGASSGSFQGFSQASNTENLVHKVPAMNAHAHLGIGPLSIYSEFVTTVESFDPLDLTYNGAGAQPKAAHIEGDYTFKLFNKTSVFTLAYDESWESLALGLPKNSYIADFSMSIWKNTVETIEFRHDVNYEVTDSAGGICQTPAGVITVCPVPQVGSSQNTILGQIGVYF